MAWGNGSLRGDQPSSCARSVLFEDASNIALEGVQCVWPVARAKLQLLAGQASAGRSSPFSFTADKPLLSAALYRRSGASLITIDSIVQAVSGDVNENADDRRGLTLLLELAENDSAAVLGITHVNKGSAKKESIERINGSLVISAEARILHLSARCSHATGDKALSVLWGVLVRAKFHFGDC